MKVREECHVNGRGWLMMQLIRLASPVGEAHARILPADVALIAVSTSAVEAWGGLPVPSTHVSHNQRSELWKTATSEWP
jgi:hypothetical protein